MSYGANLMIAWAMFQDWLKEVFGSGCAFYSEPLCPQPVVSYVK